MIELYAIYKFCKLIGRALRAKGYEPSRYQLLLVAAWFGGEFAGSLFGLLLATALWGGMSPVVYLFALIGAACGVALVMSLVRSKPDLRLLSGGPSPELVWSEGEKLVNGAVESVADNRPI